MSDTTTASAPLLPYAIARAFKPKDVFGEPKRLLRKMPQHKEGDLEGSPIDGNYAPMGHIMGTVSGVMVSERPNRDGGVDRSYGLDGTFEAIPVDRERNPIRTNKAWFATHIHDAIAGLLKNYDPVDGEVREGGADLVDVAFEIGIKANSKSSTGFTWEYKPLIELQAKAHDPLAHLRDALPAGVLPLALPGVVDRSEGEIVEGTERGDAPSEVEQQQAGAASANAAGSVEQVGKGRAKR